MKYFVSIVILFFFFSACERPTEIEIPPHEPKIVAESLRGQNELIHARISRTRSVTDPRPDFGQPDPYLITNATVSLYENNTLIETLQYDANDEEYKAVIATVVPGKTYKLIAKANGLPDAEAISATPSQTPINSLVFTPNARNDRDGNPLDEIKIVFTDNSATEDYYLIRIWDANHFQSYYCVTTNDKDVEKLVYEDPLYPDDCLYPDRLLIADKNFNGTTKTLTFYMSSGLLNPVITPGNIRRATVDLLHINFDYYKYIKSLNSYENAYENPFAEPVNLHSNVKNGHGLFTTYAIAVDSVR